jgi:ketosteroid isomerase-like protein
MRKVNLGVSALFVVLLLATPLALAQGETVEQQISTLTDQVTQAQLKADTSFFEKYYADDVAIIHSDGKLSTRAQEVENLKSGTLKYESIEILDKKIRVYGNTAIVTALVDFKGVVSGKHRQWTPLRRTTVWMKQNGDWKVVAYQVTRTPQEKQVRALAPPLIEPF